MSTCEYLPPLTFVSARDTHSSVCKSLAPSSCASLAFESAREDGVWDSSSIEDDVDAVRSANSFGADEEAPASSFASTFDEASANVFSIKPPVYAKPMSRRPWVGISSSSKQAADVVGSQSHAMAARLLSEEETSKYPPTTTTYTSSAHDNEGVYSAAGNPCQTSGQAWAADGSARPSVLSEMQSTRTVCKDHDTLGLEASPVRTDLRQEVETDNRELLKSSVGQFGGVSGQSRSASKPRAQKDSLQRRVNASRFVSAPGCTSLAQEDITQHSDVQRRLKANGFVSLPIRSRMAAKRPSQRPSSNGPHSEQIGSPKRSESREEATQHSDVQQRLKANGFVSLPIRSRLAGERPSQRASSNGPQFEQIGSPKRSESIGTPKWSESVRPTLMPPSPRVVSVSREDAKGSVVKYNCVQFTATPSLSTSCDKSPALTPRSPKAQSTSIAKAAKHEGFPDAQSAAAEVLRMFSGCSKREVKEMLKGTYTREEIAEVLEILSLEGGTPRRSRSKKASRACRG